MLEIQLEGRLECRCDNDADSSLDMSWLEKMKGYFLPVGYENQGAVCVF